MLKMCIRDRFHPHKKSAGDNRMADVQLMQVGDASQQLFQILVIDAMARIHLDAQRCV